MSISMQAATAVVYARMLRNMLTWLNKAEAHAQLRGFDPQQFLSQRLAVDMLPFSKQVGIASDIACLAVARLAGAEMRPWTGADDNLNGLREHVLAAIDFIESVPAAGFSGSASRDVVLPQRKGNPLHFTGEGFVQQWAQPNFFFHVTTAYALLRQAGVDVGKADFLGTLPS